MFLFFLFFFTFILLSTGVAQVKIKEKVEIKPGGKIITKGLNSTASSSYWPCGPYIHSSDESNPWQVVWRGATHPLDVAQQAFNYQDNDYHYSVFGTYTVEVIQGAENCKLTEVFRCDSITGECPDPISQDLGTRIENVSHVDMEGEGDFMIWQGIPSRIGAGYVRYQIRFIKEGNVTVRYTSNHTGAIIDYHTLVVLPDFYLEYTGEGEIPHGEEADVDVREHPIQCTNAWEDTTGGVIHGFWNGGGLPDEVKFNVSIIEGAEYGSLINNTYDDVLFLQIRDTATAFNGLDDTDELLFAAMGTEPQDTGIVKIRYSTTDNNIPPIEQEIKIVPNTIYPLRVTMEPEQLMPGDTSFIILEHRKDTYPISDPNSVEYEPFEADQLFDIKVDKGSEYGTIFSIAANDTSDEFEQVTDGFFFIANDTINVESAEISIRARAKIYYFNGEPAAAIKENNKKVSKNKNKNSIAIIGVPTSNEEVFGIGKATIGDNAIEILLGESKYFAVKKRKSVDDYKIIEIQTNYGEQPKWTNVTLSSDWEWVKNADVWGTDPIEKLGSKSGVYWEKKWYNKTNNKNVNLESGMIRLIGRYWEEGMVDSFKVKLNAKINNEIKDSIEIKVVKPDELLTEGQSPSYSKARDVFNNAYSIDSVCIKYGGLYGIPPQMLKGQMLQESSIKNFGDSVGMGFAPSYRYEPYTTQFDKFTIELLTADTNPFIVTKNPDAMGKPDAASVPTKTEHQHLEHDKYFHYFESAKSVWDVIEEKSQLVDANNIYSTYGFQYKGTGPDTLKKGYIKVAQLPYVLQKFLEYLKGTVVNFEDSIATKYNLNENENLTIPQQTEANDSARLATIRYLKNEYKPNNSEVKGLDNTPAQTRIAASYGLLQCLYTTVLDEHNYPVGNSNNPELLNLVDTNMVYSMKHLKKLFEYKYGNKFSLDKNDNWVSKRTRYPHPNAGFEEALQVMFLKWNYGYEKFDKRYHTWVQDNSEKFIPRRK